jgi:hypothetical protein
MAMANANCYRSSPRFFSGNALTRIADFSPGDIIMNRINLGHRFSVAASSVLCTGLIASAPARAALDNDAITLSFTALSHQITWQLAGNDVSTAGVNGTLGPFNNACAILHGTPRIKGNVRTRPIYVLDGGDSSSDPVLYVYTRTDTIRSNEGYRTDAVTVGVRDSVALSLKGQANISCYMAANDNAIFLGTSANLSAEIIRKDTLAHEVVSQPLISYGFTVSAITASNNGIVFITWGTGPESGWAEYDQDSQYVATGQNFNFTVLAGTTNATTF